MKQSEDTKTLDMFSNDELAMLMESVGIKIQSLDRQVRNEKNPMEVRDIFQKKADEYQALYLKVRQKMT